MHQIIIKLIYALKISLKMMSLFTLNYSLIINLK